MSIVKDVNSSTDTNCFSLRVASLQKARYIIYKKPEKAPTILSPNYVTCLTFRANPGKFLPRLD